MNKKFSWFESAQVQKFMINLLKYTYTLQIEKIDKELKKYWRRYQEILEKPNWEKLNEARAILYLLGQVYCEKIAPEAIKRRLHLLNKPLSLLKFLTMIDNNSKELKKYRKDGLFFKLEKFYKLIKKIKNKFVGGRYYLDEERFIKLYNKYCPDKNLMIGYKGTYKNKR